MLKFLRRPPLALLALLLAVPAFAQSRPAVTPAVRPFVAVDAPVVALTRVRVVDGTGAPARDDQTIIVRGGRIDAVGPPQRGRISQCLRRDTEILFGLCVTGRC
ncbi:MAG TPA: hypothetical protein VGC13_13905 [Longimicrobium sp.]|uniref:hypothetical protein n=1 Tax=Longimicrobium sp. TaxID=2029185 RepID=UPI002ED871DC